MPISYEIRALSTGVQAVVATSTGLIDVDDANEYASRMKPGTPEFALPALFISRGKVDITPEARSIFTSKSLAQRATRLGVVIDNAPMRVLVNFLMRIAGTNANVRMFNGEAEATAWLSEVKP